MPQVQTVLADVTTSISELKKNPVAVVEQGEGFPVAVLNRNYLVSDNLRYNETWGLVN